MSRASPRRLLTYAAFASLIVIIGSDVWLHLPFVVTLGLTLVLAVETCWTIFEVRR